MALILGVARRLVEGDSYARSGKYRSWAPLLFLGADVHHKTLGLLGFGRVGFAVAKRAVGFGMRIRSYSLKPQTLSLFTSPSPVKPGISLDIENCA